MENNSFLLLIFDCDGVLVDSELLGNQVLAEMICELGLMLNAEAASRLFKGCKLSDCLTTISEQLGSPLPDDFEVVLRTRTAEAFRSKLQPVSGIHKALERLPNKVCVASSGPREKITLALSITGLLPRFQKHIFSSYEVGSWKPEPDLFLHAAATYDVPP
jgi:HAD superfamily hydrolase (TIGR01509 family)